MTPDEWALWRSVTRMVVPNSRGDAAAQQESSRFAAPDPGHPARIPTRGSAVRGPDPPPMAALEPRLRRLLTQGRAGVDAVLDLHGFTEARAHRSVIEFVTRQQSVGSKLVLIVTGKGRPAAPFSEGGILRRSVPLWLREPGLRFCVLAVEEAAPIHGGAGALYVRLRRRRPQI